MIYDKLDWTVTRTHCCSTRGQYNYCAVLFMLFIVDMQTSRESGEIPPDQRPVRVCMVDYLKSDQLEAVNRGEDI